MTPILGLAPGVADAFRIQLGLSSLAEPVDAAHALAIAVLIKFLVGGITRSMIRYGRSMSHEEFLRRGLKSDANPNGQWVNPYMEDRQQC